MAIIDSFILVGRRAQLRRKATIDVQAMMWRSGYLKRPGGGRPDNGATDLGMMGWLVVVWRQPVRGRSRAGNCKENMFNDVFTRDLAEQLDWNGREQRRLTGIPSAL